MLVYQALFPNGKSYIGITKCLIKRKKSHKSRSNNGSMLPFHSAIRKYGWNSIIWKTLYTSNEFEDLKKQEILLIQTNNTIVPHGYNLTKGGEGTIGLSPWNKNKKMPESAINNMRKSSKGKKCVLVDTVKKTITEFDSIRNLAKAIDVNYGVVKIAAKRGSSHFHYKIFTKDNFKLTDDIFENKPSHNAIKIKITNGSEIKEFSSLTKMRNFLNISENDSYKISRKNMTINGWVKYEQ